MKIKSAYIEITNICNLNCRSCYNRSGFSRERKEISMDDMLKIADRLVNEFGCERISLSGGEPTLHSGFGAMLNLLTEKYDGMDIVVVTNGTTQNADLIKEFNRHSNISVQVSLDGSNEEVNARTRGKDNFDKAVHFLSILDKTKSPAVKMVVSANNITDVEPFYELVASMGCIPEFDFIGNIGNAGNVWQTLKLTAKQKLYVLRKINELNKKHDIEARLPYCTSFCPLADPNADHSVLIKTNGDMFPCQMLYDEKYRLGNILSDSADVFEKAFVKLAETAKARAEKDYGCKKCVVRSFCKKGCMAFAQMNNGDPLANDGECDFRKLQLIGFHAMEK